MTSTREIILQALFAQLQTIDGPKVLRNEVLPERIPTGGLIILCDGDPGQPEIMLSPLSYYWQHQATAEVLVTDANAATRDAALDNLFASIADVLAADRTLGGLCDRVMPDAPVITTLGIDGAPSVKAATVNIELIYTTADQLG